MQGPEAKCQADVGVCGYQLANQSAAFGKAEPATSSDISRLHFLIFLRHRAFPKTIHWPGQIAELRNAGDQPIHELLRGAQLHVSSCSCQHIHHLVTCFAPRSELLRLLKWSFAPRTILSSFASLLLLATSPCVKRRFGRSSLPTSGVFGRRLKPDRNHQTFGIPFALSSASLYGSLTFSR